MFSFPNLLKGSNEKLQSISHLELGLQQFKNTLKIKLLLTGAVPLSKWFFLPTPRRGISSVKGQTHTKKL